MFALRRRDLRALFWLPACPLAGRPDARQRTGVFQRGVGPTIGEGLRSFGCKESPTLPTPLDFFRPWRDWRTG